MNTARPRTAPPSVRCNRRASNTLPVDRKRTIGRRGLSSRRTLYTPRKISAPRASVRWPALPYQPLKRQGYGYSSRRVRSCTLNGGEIESGALMKVRWWVCFLLFLVWVMSYVDRSLMPMAIPFVAREFHISPAVMGVVLSAFFVGYAVMQIPGGLIADKIGPRKTVSIGITAWSLFSVLTGIAGNLTQLISIRIGFGLGEGVFPPASFKTLAAWFPREERTRASAVMLSSNTIGPMVTPILFAGAMTAFGWRGAFLAISVPGFLLAAAAYWYLRDHPAEHPGITARELAENSAGNKRGE